MPDKSQLEHIASETLPQLNINYRGKMVGGHYVNPFPVPTAYAAVIPLFISSSGDVSLLFGTQFKNRKQPELGIRPFLTFPSGYMRPIPPVGKVIQKDEILEEAKLTNSSVTSSGISIEDTDARDASSRDNALREWREEVLYEQELTNMDLQFVGSISDQAYAPKDANEQIFHIMGQFYTVIFTEEQVSRMTPGDDLAELILIPVKDISFDISDTTPQRVGNGSRFRVNIPTDLAQKAIYQEL